MLPYHAAPAQHLSASLPALSCRTQQSKHGTGASFQTPLPSPVQVTGRQFTRANCQSWSFSCQTLLTFCCSVSLLLSDSSPSSMSWCYRRSWPRTTIPQPRAVRYFILSHGLISSKKFKTGITIPQRTTVSLSIVLHMFMIPEVKGGDYNPQASSARCVMLFHALSRQRNSRRG